MPVEVPYWISSLFSVFQELYSKIIKAIVMFTASQFSRNIWRYRHSAITLGKLLEVASCNDKDFYSPRVITSIFIRSEKMTVRIAGSHREVMMAGASLPQLEWELQNYCGHIPRFQLARTLVVLPGLAIPLDSQMLLCHLSICWISSACYKHESKR